MAKTLTSKQQLALELLTSGAGLTYKEVAEQVGVNAKTIWRWRNEPDFAHFQAELEKINEQRWLATIDLARASARKLVEEGNPKLVEFVLKNAGYNPATKIDADVNTDITITIGE